VELRFQKNPPPFLPVSSQCMPISDSHYVPSVHLFRGLTLFLIPCILAGTIDFGILPLFILSICPYLLTLSDSINFAMFVIICS
jgi:hypothetical protein